MPHFESDVSEQGTVQATTVGGTSSSIMHLSGPIIQVVVGENRDIFNIHETVLCKTSEYFQSAMKPEWRFLRDHPNVLDLPDDNAILFALYAHWLYTQTVPDLQVPALDRLTHAYILGEKLLDTQFKNTIADAIIYQYKNITAPTFEVSTITALYEGTMPTSPGRRLISDLTALYWVSDGIDWTGWNNCPKAFLIDVIHSTSRWLVDRPADYWIDTTSLEDYHQRTE